MLSKAGLSPDTLYKDSTWWADHSETMLTAFGGCGHIIGVAPFFPGLHDILTVGHKKLIFCG
jgi:hypothetical protein